MKIKSSILFFGFLLISQVGAATYIFNNGLGTNASGIVDASGNAFRGSTTVGDTFSGNAGGVSAGPGVLAIGVFSDEDFSTVIFPLALEQMFTGFGDATFNFATGGPAGNRGLFAASTASITIEGNEDFEGKNYYLFVGNGSSFSNSTQFLIVKSDLTFSADDDGPNVTTVTFSPGTSEVLLGSTVPNVLTTSNDTSTTTGWQLAPLAIPEPSSALLCGFGALIALRRRR